MSRRIRLRPHPEHPAPWVTDLSVDIAVRGTALALAYRLAYAPGRLRLPARDLAGRRDGLWRQTCFELFAAGADWPAYREFNFSPSDAWQAYAFRGYRDGGPLQPATAPDVVIDAGEGRLCVTVQLPLADLPVGGALRLGLSAVLADADGVLSYWAARHPPGKPDFHHPDTLALQFDPRIP